MAAAQRMECSATGAGRLAAGNLFGGVQAAARRDGGSASGVFVAFAKMVKAGPARSGIASDDEVGGITTIGRERNGGDRSAHRESSAAGGRNAAAAAGRNRKVQNVAGKDSGEAGTELFVSVWNSSGF